MDYLLSAFIEALAQEQNSYVENGRIYIRTHHWSPEDVLKAMLTQEAFKNSFDAWIAERQEELVTTAEDILKQFNLEDRFQALSEVYKQDAVTPFIGAGLSMPSNYPSWTAFLRKLRLDTDIDESHFEQLLKIGQYEEAAELLSNKIRPGFNEAVHNAFGISREIFGCVQYLPYVFDTAVITTNFDNVLKRCYDNARKPFAETIPGNLVEQLPRILATGNKVLVMLHGTATTGTGRILTKTEYDRHYIKQNSHKQAITALCQGTLLFIGCSLYVDRTLGVMKQLVKKHGHDNITRHYAFLEDTGSSETRTAKRNELLACNIYPIWYPAGEHDSSIEAFLTKLAFSKE